MRQHVNIHVGPIGSSGLDDGTKGFIEIDGRRIDGIRRFQVDSGVAELTVLTLEMVNVDVSIEADIAVVKVEQADLEERDATREDGTTVRVQNVTAMGDEIMTHKVIS